MNPVTDTPSNFTVRQGLFPENRPDIQPQGLTLPPQPKVVPGITVDQAVDMEIVGLVISRLELSKTWRRQFRLVWDRCIQNRKGVYNNANKAAWQSTTFMPLTSKVIEVIKANLYGALAAPEVPIEYQSRNPAMDQEVRSVNELINADLDKTKFKPVLSDMIDDICTFGTTIGEVGYIKQMEEVMVKQRLPGEISQLLGSMGVSQTESFVPKQMLVKDYGTISRTDLYDFYPEPRVAEISKDHWCIVKSKITNRELVMGANEPDPYYKFDNVTDDLLEGSGLQRTDQDPELQTRRFALLDYNIYTHYLDPDREHELATFYGMIPVWFLDPELRKDKQHRYDAVPGCLKVVDGQYVIWKRISPWRDGEPPYFKGNYIRIAGQFYGIGVAELVLGLQTEKNEIRNSRMDNINIAMNKIIAVIKDMVPATEWNRLVSEPGAIWLFKGVDDVRKAMQQIEFGDVTKDSWLASREVDQEAQEATAAVKATLGVQGNESDAGGNTFRGQMLNAQMATERWMLYARVFEMVGLVPAIKKFYQRIYQFKTMEDAQKILGGDRAKTFQFISPEDLELVAKLVPLGVMTMENKGVKLAQMNQYTQLWQQQPFFKALEMARKMWVEMGNPEPDSVLFSDEEMQLFNQARMTMINQSSMMPGGGMSQPPGLLGPNGQPISGTQPQTGNRANVPGGMPVSGNVPGPLYGQARPALPARGPGASPFDQQGRPIS
jgi:hypothetical protein